MVSPIILGVSVINGITGNKNIPQVIPSFFRYDIVSILSVGEGTPGSKIELILSFVEEKLKLTITCVFLLIFFIRSISLFTSVDFVSI